MITTTTLVILGILSYFSIIGVTSVVLELFVWKEPIDEPLLAIGSVLWPMTIVALLAVGPLALGRWLALRACRIRKAKAEPEIPTGQVHEP